MLIQESHEARLPAPPRDQRRHIMHDIKRVRPHIALGPSLVLARPRPVGIARLHEARRVVKQGEGRGERARAEERRVVRLVERHGERGHGVVVVYDKEKG